MRHSMRLAAAVSALAMAASAASAQTAATAESEGGLADIVVTAERRSESIQRTPVAVTALLPETLREANIRDTQQLTEKTPNLNISPSGGGSPVSPQVTLRGQFQNGINITNDPSVGLYIDDVYIGKDAGSIADIVDVSRVEVLKGPQGTLFGRNTTGGAVRYISARPDPSELSGSVRVGYGNYETYLAQGVINLPLSEIAAVRLVGSYRGHDGYTTSLIGSQTAAGVVISDTLKTNDLESLLLRGSLLVEPSDNLSILVVGSYHDREVNGRLNRNLTFGDLGPGRGLSPQAQANFYTGLASLTNAFGVAQDDRSVSSKGHMISAQADWRSSDAFGAKLIVGYVKNTTDDTFFDVDGTILPLVGSVVLQKFKQFSAELQFSGQLLDDRLDYITGVYYFDEKGPDLTTPTFATAAGSIQQQTIGFGHNKSFSGFGHAKYLIGESTHIQAGVRYTSDRKNLVVDALQTSTNPLVPRCIYTPGPNITINATTCRYDPPEATFNFWSYTAGIDHQFAPGVFVYARTSKGQRSGGQQIRSTAGDVSPFRPETLTDYEVGAKLDLLDRRLRVNIAAFTGDYKDIQLTRILITPAGTTTTVVQNVGSATIRGFELETAARLPAGFGLEFGYGVTDVKNAPEARFPKNTYNGAITFEHEFDAGEFKARLDWFRRSHIELRDVGVVAPIVGNPIPSYSTLGGRIGFTTKSGIDVAVYGSNLTKNKYYINGLNLGGNFVIGYPGDPRTYGIEVGFKF